MTTRELHESKLIQRAWMDTMERVNTGQIRYPNSREAFAEGHRAGYDEGLKWADNKKQIAATRLRDMLQLYQEGKRGLPAYSELIAILRLVEGYDEDKMPVSLTAAMREDRALTPFGEALAETTAAFREQLALGALRKLRDVVTARNREGMDWGEHFGALMSALCHAHAVLPEVDKNVVTGAELDRLQGRARLISRLQACFDDPLWPNHAAVPKKLLEACLSALVNPLSE